MNTFNFDTAYAVWQKVTFKFPSDDGEKVNTLHGEVKFRVPDFDSITDRKISDFIEDWRNIPGEGEFNRVILEKRMKNPIFFRAMDDAWVAVLRGEFLTKNSAT
jgi:hypothetical protein